MEKDEKLNKCTTKVMTQQELQRNRKTVSLESPHVPLIIPDIVIFKQLGSQKLNKDRVMSSKVRDK